MNATKSVSVNTLKQLWCNDQKLVRGFYYHLVAQAGIIVNNWQYEVRYCS